MMAQKSNPNAPDEVSHLLSIVDALEAVLSLKRSGRARHVLFRADKAAVEQASRRDFKVRYVTLTVMLSAVGVLFVNSSSLFSAGEAPTTAEDTAGRCYRAPVGQTSAHAA